VSIGTIGSGFWPQQRLSAAATLTLHHPQLHQQKARYSFDSTRGNEGAAATRAPPVVPSQARVVVVGGGIIGSSVAYHLAKMGCKDVVLLEKEQLTAGTTWRKFSACTSLHLFISLFFFSPTFLQSIRDAAIRLTPWLQMPQG